MMTKTVGIDLGTTNSVIASVEGRPAGRHSQRTRVKDHALGDAPSGLAVIPTR
jgi:molecular chaperone DnaK (HSP70)